MAKCKCSYRLIKINQFPDISYLLQDFWGNPFIEPLYS